MRGDRVGRAIGATGAACGMLLWGFLLIAFLGVLLEPGRWHQLVLFIVVPVVVAITMVLVATIVDFVVLVRRADRSLPARVAIAHVALAAGSLWMGAPRLACVLVAIAATQLVAVRLFQMMPSQPASQR